AKDAAYHREKMLLCKQEEARIQLNAEQERELLASLIEKLKCEIDESKNHNTILETSNKVLVEKLKRELEDFRNKNKSLTEANNKLSKENDLPYAEFKKSKAELKRHDSIEYATEMELEYTISILKQQKDAQIKLYKSREDKEIEKVIDLENKVKVLDNIVYKTGQTVQTMNMLNNKCRTSFAKPEFLKKAQRANPRLYDIGCYNDNLALMLAPESDKVIRLEKESRSKLSDLVRPFDCDKLNNLYDLFVPQREKSSEQRYFSKRSRLSRTSVNNGNSKESFNKQATLLEKRMDESISWDKKCKSSIEIFKIKNLNVETLNVNFVSATCDKCVLNDKHDMCVLNSVAKPFKKTVASESNQKPRNITRKLYERISKACSWWYPKFTPSGYKWKPKSRKENVTLIISMPLGSVSRTANILERMTSRRSTVSNTLFSSNSFAARRDCPIHHRLWVLKAHDGKSQASN
nr:hypothetical protein [Tanacetum cinerariifolium]